MDIECNSSTGKFPDADVKGDLWCTCFITKTEVLFFVVCALDRDACFQIAEIKINFSKIRLIRTGCSNWINVNVGDGSQLS